MSAYALIGPDLPWSADRLSDRRFNRILSVVAGFCLIAGTVVPMLDIPEIEWNKPTVKPVSRIKLVIEPPKPVPLKPVVKQAEKPVPVKKTVPKQKKAKPIPKKPKVAQQKPAKVNKPLAKKPKVAAVKPKAAAPAKPKPSAREKAAKAGLLAFAGDLSSLATSSGPRNSNKSAALRAGPGESSRKTRSVVTSATGRSSGGIDTSRYSRDAGAVSLGSRKTVKVAAVSAGAGGAGRSVAGASRDVRGGRSSEEIQWVFDRNKGAIYSIYNRALRQSPELQGKVVVELTIAPSGKVQKCRIVSTELNDTRLEAKLLARLRSFDFGAKDVDTVTVVYPIDFLPS